MKKLQEKRRFNSEIRMLHKVPILDSILKNSGFVFEDHFNALIDISKPKEELWEQLKKDRKYMPGSKSKLRCVIKDVPPYTVVAGVPAKEIKKIGIEK